MFSKSLQKPQPYQIYLNTIIGIGLIVLLWSIFTVSQIEDKWTFIYIAILGAVSQVTTTTIQSKTGSVTYAISPAISLAAIPFWGPAGAIIIDVSSAIIVWFIKPAEKGVWKKSIIQLSFNVAMSSLALLGAGYVFEWAQQFLGANSLLGVTIPWLLAAVALDQLNLWLLIGILRLQQGSSLNVFEMWFTDSWASRISIAIMSFGGGLLAYAIQNNDWIGILAYFLPILLSAYAFRLYVSQMRAHLDNLEQIIDTRTQKLKEIMAEKDSFLAVLTHDMKTPLTSIGLYGDIMKSNPEALVKKPRIADIILRNQKDLLEIVNNILDLEKLSVDGTIPLEKEKYDLCASLERVVESVSMLADKKNIRLTYDTRSFPILIHADRWQIERVMQNLVSNAIKYTPKDGSVSINVVETADGVAIEISDTGLGIPESDLPHIFDRFRRVEKHRKQALGTGLGLAIAKALVESHDGSITVFSEEGKGSTFTVELPSPVEHPVLA